MSESKKLSVLIVDDEQHICDLIEVMLKSFNIFSFIVASTSASLALQKLRNQEFDLLIIDNQMPDKDGLHMIETLMLTQSSRKHRIIFMSGAMQNEHALKAINFGVKTFLIKPFTRQGLLKAVIKALGKK
tara:strand:- start:2375 stop:2764 length:390 start_codon:yes stop_codon:yes gene_type:complete